jgi:hypothetical protein
MTGVPQVTLGRRSSAGQFVNLVIISDAFLAVLLCPVYGSLP